MAALLDFNPTVIGAVYATQKNFKEITPNIIRHVILNMILRYRRKFKNEYGDLIVCCDSGSYWRSEFFPYYKHSRKLEKSANELIDWEVVNQALQDMHEEFCQYLPFKVIKVDKCEADDIIAVLARELSKTEKVLIISGDKDFKQLHNENIVQFAPIPDAFLRVNDAKEFLIEHVIRGDKQDGIPNILSNDDCFVMKKRQGSITEKVIETVRTCGVPVEHKSRWDRNKRLIDLSMIPVEYQTKILEECAAYKVPPKLKIIDYIGKYRIKNMFDKMSMF